MILIVCALMCWCIIGVRACSACAFCLAAEILTKYLLLSSNRLNGSGNIDVLAGPFIFIDMNGFLLFFISLKSLFISYCVAAVLGTFIGRATTGTWTGSCTGICTCMGKFTFTAGFGFTKDAGI